MKPANLKKLKSIAGRVRDLKSRYGRELDAAKKGAVDENRRTVPRVSVAVVAEGLWLVRAAERLSAKAEVTVGEGDGKAIDAAKSFFSQAREGYAEQWENSGFIPSLDALFIDHMEKTALLVSKMDAQIKAAPTKIEALDLDPDEDEDADAEDTEVLSAAGAGDDGDV